MEQIEHFELQVGDKSREESGLILIGSRLCLLELGDRWQLPTLEAELQRLSPLAPPERAAVWAQLLIGTQFSFESNLPEPPVGALRVRLASLDCVTLVYTLVALSTASSVVEFVDNLAKIRYFDNGDALCTDGAYGNMYHFVEESLIEQAVASGILKDVTRDLIADQNVRELEVRLDAINRPVRNDRQSKIVVPQRPGRVLKTPVIAVNNLEQIPADLWRDGDIVIFAKDPELSEGDLKRILVRHLGVVVKREGRPTFIHSSRNFALRPDVPENVVVDGTGIFYDSERHCEQLGVDYCGQYAGAQYELVLGGERYHAMCQRSLRSVAEYAMDKFDAIKVLRLIVPDASPRTMCSTVADDE